MAKKNKKSNKSPTKTERKQQREASKAAKAALAEQAKGKRKSKANKRADRTLNSTMQPSAELRKPKAPDPVMGSPKKKKNRVATRRDDFECFAAGRAPVEVTMEDVARAPSPTNQTTRRNGPIHSQRPKGTAIAVHRTRTIGNHQPLKRLMRLQRPPRALP